MKPQLISKISVLEVASLSEVSVSFCGLETIIKIRALSKRGLMMCLKKQRLRNGLLSPWLSKESLHSASASRLEVQK